MRKISTYELPRDKSFDSNFSLGALEHGPGSEALFEGNYVLLKPGGASWIVCPDYSLPSNQNFETLIVVTKRIGEKILRQRIRIPEFRCLQGALGRLLTSRGFL